MQINVGDTCAKCKYSTEYEKDKAHVYIYCEITKKSYIYGKSIDCNFFKKNNEKYD